MLAKQRLERRDLLAQCLDFTLQRVELGRLRGRVRHRQRERDRGHTCADDEPVFRARRDLRNLWGFGCRLWSNARRQGKWNG
jgi:hypothetical protein